MSEMSEQRQSTEKRQPPYLSYRTFRNFLDSLGAQGVPNRIDRGVLASMSGSNQILLVSALRYFGLITSKNSPTAELEKLVSLEGGDRQKTWRRIFTAAYPPIFNAGINLQRATTEELSELFSKNGVSSVNTNRKCVTFFCLAAKDAGIKLSPHIKPYAGRRRRSAVTDEPATRIRRKEESPATQTVSTDFDRILAKFPPYDPSWPEELKKSWFEGIARVKEIADSKTNLAAEKAPTEAE